MADRVVQNLIDGAARSSVDGRSTAFIDPATGAQFAEAPLSGAADVDQACSAAARTFETWREVTPAERSLALLRIAYAFEDGAGELVHAECDSTGKPYQLTLVGDLPPSCAQIRFFAGAARVLEGRAAGEYMAGHTSTPRREPVGVCAQATPPASGRPTTAAPCAW